MLITLKRPNSNFLEVDREFQASKRPKYRPNLVINLSGHISQSNSDCFEILSPPLVQPKSASRSCPEPITMGRKSKGNSANEHKKRPLGDWTTSLDTEVLRSTPGIS